MKVSELIEILEDCDPDADVYVMSQENYPFEHELHGVAVREEFTEGFDDDDGEQRDPEPRLERWRIPDAELPRDDVFLVEGPQVRYGSRDAWSASRRR